MASRYNHRQSKTIRSLIGGRIITTRKVGSITYVDYNLFDSDAQVLVNTVNTVGVLGKGIAKEFKKQYPDMFERYKELCEEEKFDIGNLWPYNIPDSDRLILNFPTKKHWRSRSKVEYIESGLRKFTQTYEDKGITSISFPMLGSSNGGLDWETEVKPLMEKYLKDLPIEVWVHEYDPESTVKTVPVKQTADLTGPEQLELIPDRDGLDGDGGS